MKVKQAEFVISAVGPGQYPEDALPEIALAGRSNVGKSSLINRLLGRKNLARTSSQPGKTQTLNYYRINDFFYFVDVPGYGYAKVSRSERAAWGRFIERYLLGREPLRKVLLIVDVRHPPSKDDQAMYEWLAHNGLPIAVIATKADKIPRSQWQKHVKLVRETLGMPKGDPVILFSSETGQGLDELWKLLDETVDWTDQEKPENEPK
ncbi:ribosome biogenesis GTP-binding protein YihA/YsxC [Gorillibacterium sp. sgz500922]|uniref:ribosome biogenesis GTP-binding protein YihA/YsxC n=1 Tax=Gorillibacterium sp. sgz500922 TaxID=3446694 RepID=UPI003F66CF96